MNGAWGNAIIAPRESGGLCTDHGRSSSRFGSGDAWACYTAKDWGGEEDVRCNHGPPTLVGGELTWTNEFALSSVATGGEDHPSFDFYGPNNALVVTGTERSGGDGVSARVHFPGHVNGEQIVEFPRKSLSSKIDFSDLVAANGRLQMVWRDGELADADIKYAECIPDAANGVDCTNRFLHWDEEVITDTHFGADVPELAVEGDNQFVLFHYDSGGAFGDDRYRVALAERCVDDVGWTISDIRPFPDVFDDDQHNKFGRPSIALDRINNIVHVVFAEVVGYSGTWEPGSAGDLHWYRRDYTDCPE